MIVCTGGQTAEIENHSQNAANQTDPRAKLDSSPAPRKNGNRRRRPTIPVIGRQPIFPFQFFPPRSATARFVSRFSINADRWVVV